MTDESNSPFGIYQHDSRELQSRLKEEFDDINGLVDTIITSPPYADLIDYGNHDEQVGQQKYESFLNDIRLVYKQCYDIAAEDCTLWVITDTYKTNGRVVRLPFDIADELENLQNHEICLETDCTGHLQRNRGNGTLVCQTCGTAYDPLSESWRMEDNIIWNKLRTRPWHQKGRLRNVYEHITMYSKTDDFTYNKDAIRITDPDEFKQWWVNYPERYSPKGIVPTNVWEFPIPKQGQWGPKVSYHPSPFPEDLVQRIVHLASDPGDVVFDPFAGIGTTLAIAEALDRKPLGFELNNEYIEYYKEHVRPTALREVGSVQTTLQDEQALLQDRIYTLRVHKYAYELYKELISTGKNGLHDGQIEFIQTTSDPAQFDQELDPAASLVYVCESSEDFKDISIDTAVEEMLSENKGSGDYYGVDFDPTFCTVADYLETLRTDLPTIFNENVYLYQGRHNWVEDSMEIGDWIDCVESGAWLQYWSKTRPPLVSNLNIQVENPMENSSPEPGGTQAGLESFK